MNILITWLNIANILNRTDNSKCTLNVVGGPKKYETSCFIPLKHEMNTEKSVL